MFCVGIKCVGGLVFALPQLLGIILINLDLKLFSLLPLVKINERYCFLLTKQTTHSKIEQLPNHLTDLSKKSESP